MTINPRSKNLFFQISAILILLSAVVFSFRPEVAKYMIILGAVGFVATTFMTPYPGKSIRGKRLFNMQVLAAILMAVSAFLMYIDRTEWVVSLLVASLLTLYAAIVIPQAYKQELAEIEEGKKKKKNK